LLPHYDAKIARLQKMGDTPEVQAKLTKARAKRDEAFSPDRIERDGKTVHRSLVEKASRLTDKQSAARKQSAAKKIQKTLSSSLKRKKARLEYGIKAADRKRVKREIAQMESTVAQRRQALAAATATQAIPAKVSLFSRLSNFVRGGVSPEYAAKSNKAQAVKNAETEKAAAEEALAIKRFESTILKSEKKAMREANPELNALRKPKAKVATEAAE
jgi:hypothetical protein